MLKKIFFQKLRSMSKIRILKFLIIFSLTGTSSIFASDHFIFFLENFLNLNLNFYSEIIFIIIFYHLILVIICYVFGEFSYILTKLRRLKQLFNRV